MLDLALGLCAIALAHLRREPDGLGRPRQLRIAAMLAFAKRIETSLLDLLAAHGGGRQETG